MQKEEIKKIERFLEDKFELSLPDSIEELEQKNRFDEMRILLIQRLDEMLSHDFEGLMNLLYRIDVDEQKLKTKLAIESDVPATAIMADMIIERQLQKLQTRKQYGDGESDWSFDV